MAMPSDVADTEMELLASLASRAGPSRPAGRDERGKASVGATRPRAKATAGGRASEAAGGSRGAGTRGSKSAWKTLAAAEGTRPGGGGGEEREALSRMLDRIVRKHQPADSSSSPTKIVSPRSGKKKAGEALSKRQQEQQICVENMFVLAEALEEVRVSSLQREAVEKKCADAAAAYERYRSV